MARILALASILAPSVYAAAATTGEFNVLTFNVAGLPQLLQSNGETGDKTTNTATMGRIFSANKEAFDIINVQEDFNYHATLYESDTHQFRTATSGGAAIGSGLNTLSNYDWIDFERVKWNKCNGLVSDSNDCLTPKGFTFMRVRIDEGVYVDAFNLHTDAGTSQGDQDARTSNVQQVVDYINANSVGNPVIVWGDTNSRYTRELDNIRVFTQNTTLADPWVDIAKSGSAPAAGAEALLCDNPSKNTDCETVDKVFYRGNKIVDLKATDFRYISDMFLSSNGTALSDHNPVLVNLTYSLSANLRQSDFWGGPHGTWFNDLPKLPETPKLASVVLKGSSRLDSIALTLSDGTSFTHGGTGGTASELKLDSGDYITTAQLCQGKKDNLTRIFYLKLTSNGGKTVEAGTSTSDCLTVKAPADGFGIVGSAGRGGDNIDRLGFIYGKN